MYSFVCCFTIVVCTFARRSLASASVIPNVSGVNPSRCIHATSSVISMRTKEGLAAAKASGKKLGRRKGALGKSKLDGREDEIKRFLALDVSKASIAKITGVDRSTLYNFIRSRGIVPNL